MSWSLNFSEHDDCKITIYRYAFCVPEHDSLAYWMNISNLIEAAGSDHLDTLQKQQIGGMEVAK